jgi:hypothetical protein
VRSLLRFIKFEFKLTCAVTVSFLGYFYFLKLKSLVAIFLLCSSERI